MFLIFNLKVSPGEKAKYDGADVIFVMARTMVCVSLNPVNVLNHMAEGGFKSETKWGKYAFLSSI